MTRALRLLVVMVSCLMLAAPAAARRATRIKLSTVPSPSQVGQMATLQAEIDGLGGGAPTGSVRFADGYTPLGASTMSATGMGQATLAAELASTCALTDLGGAACWGNNIYGRLGDGTNRTRAAPVSVAGLERGVVALALGHYHGCALTEIGVVECWGSNTAGQLGDGTRTDHWKRVAVSGLPSGAVAIAAGGWRSCALTSGGAVACWGELGLLGGSAFPRFVPGLSSGVVAITAGDYHTCALTAAGAVKCWGSNGYRQLGDGTATDHLTPVAVSGLSSGVAAIAARGNQTCALTHAGGVKCWGSDGIGGSHGAPFAVAGLSSGVAAISVGDDHACALTIGGAAKCWGSNFYGQLGVGTTVPLSATPVPVYGLSSGVVAIVAGVGHSCAVSNNGAMSCWGAGGLGIGTYASRPDPTPVLRITSLVRARATLSTSALGRGAHLLRAGFDGDFAHMPVIEAIPHRVVE